MRPILLVSYITLAFSMGYAQTPPSQYFMLVKTADSLYMKKQYLKSGQTFAAAFKTFGWKGYIHDRYNAASAWARAGVPDSAFSNLERISRKGFYADYRHITRNEDFASLRNNPRWKPIIQRIKENQDELESKYNRPLIDLLDSLVTEDQKWREYVRKYHNGELENDTTSLKFIQYKLKTTDSLNYFNLKQIFQTYGFPNYDLVGEKASTNFWLMIQHQDAHPEFQEEVLVKMKDEADTGKASLSNYAYLIDRVKVNTGKLQIYGTQMRLNAAQTSYEPQPVMEPEKLNERRKAVGLESIESYTDLMNTVYFGTLKK